LDAQRESIEDYCHAHKLNLLGIYQDDHTGTTLHRKGFQAALEHIQQSGAMLAEEGHKPRGKGKWSRIAAARILHRAGRVTCQPWDRSQAGPAAPPPPAQHPGDRGQRPQRDREDKRRPPTHHRQEGR
jgi:hypothetical protein